MISLTVALEAGETSSHQQTSKIFRYRQSGSRPCKKRKDGAPGEEIKEQILKTGIRKVERETKVSHHTINRILKGENVRRKTLAKIMKRCIRQS